MSGSSSKHIAAFTLVELLVALAVTAVLVTAAAVAINALVMNYRVNEDTFKAINNARQALLRITAVIRNGLVDPNDISSDDRCTVFSAEGSEVTYRYYSADNKLRLHDHGSGGDYVLCNNVIAMTFNKDNNTPTGDVKSVQISMTVANGDVQRTLSAAAVVRKIIDR